MDGLKPHTTVFLMVLLVALPALGAMALYRYTKNPYLQPLGITQAKVEVVNQQTETVSIEVLIRHGVDRRASPSKSDVRKLISDALTTRTSAFFFKFEEMIGSEIDVTYIVGANRYGPLTLGEFAEGMKSALAALEYTRYVNARDQF